MFIVFDGVEGTGKSSQMRDLACQLQGTGMDVLVTREPGGSSMGADLRTILLTPDRDVDPRAEALLMLAERAQHVAEVIKPALERGALVLCDRFATATYAYQGHARGLGMGRLREMSEWSSQGIVPDLTVIFDLDPAVGLARKTGAEIQRMEQESLDFHQRVRTAFRSLPTFLPNTVLLEAEGTYDEVAARLRRLLVKEVPDLGGVLGGLPMAG